MPFRGHHIWCNQINNRPPEECPTCIEFNKKYPESGLSEDEMLERYYPNVIKRSTEYLES
jgi:hypothetical protein